MMSKKDEALKWASELLRNIYRGDVYEVKMLIDAANACKEAIKENEIGEAEIKQMLDDIEYYQNFYVWKNHKGEIRFFGDGLNELPIEYKYIGKIKLESETSSLES